MILFPYGVNEEKSFFFSSRKRIDASQRKKEMLMKFPLYASLVDLLMKNTIRALHLMQENEIEVEFSVLLFTY